MVVHGALDSLGNRHRLYVGTRHGQQYCTGDGVENAHGVHLPDPKLSPAIRQKNDDNDHANRLRFVTTDLRTFNARVKKISE
ncbi:hypothetical protein D3C71_2043110 [compost metagenome]